MSTDTDHSRDVRRKAVSRNIESIVSLKMKDDVLAIQLAQGLAKIGWFVETINFVMLQILLVVVWVL